MEQSPTWRFENLCQIFCWPYERGGGRGGLFGRDTSLQAGRSRVRFPMVSLKFFFDIFLLHSGRNMALGLTHPLTERGTKNISWGVKACVGLTTLPPSCADCHEIWEPQPPGTLWACPGLYRDCFTLHFTILWDWLPSHESCGLDLEFGIADASFSFVLCPAQHRKFAADVVKLNVHTGSEPQTRRQIGLPHWRPKYSFFFFFRSLYLFPRPRFFLIVIHSFIYFSFIPLLILFHVFNFFRCFYMSYRSLNATVAQHDCQFGVRTMIELKIVTTTFYS